MLQMDGAELEFTDDAILAIAHLAAERNTGARGLRTILEDIMLDIMYDIPSDPTIEKVVVTKGCVEKTEKPEITRNENIKPVKKTASKTEILKENKNVG